MSSVSRCGGRTNILSGTSSSLLTAESDSWRDLRVASDFYLSERGTFGIRLGTFRAPYVRALVSESEQRQTVELLVRNRLAISVDSAVDTIIVVTGFRHRLSVKRTHLRASLD